MEFNPSDLDKNRVLEGFLKLNVDELVREVNKDLKKSILTAQLEVFDQKIKLTTTRTRFDGKKYWFVCPSCSKRVGTLYREMNGAAHCRTCTKTLYSRQKYRIEK